MEWKCPNGIKIALCILACAVICQACEDQPGDTGSRSAPQSPLTDLQTAVATYLYLPQFSFPQFAEQAFRADVMPMGYDPINRVLYLSIPRQRQRDSLFLSAICTDPRFLEVAQGYDVIDWLGPDIDRDRDTSRVVLRYPAEYMNLDSSTEIHRRIGGKEVRFTLAELTASFKHHYAYNSPALALAPGPGDVSYVIANHAAPMSTSQDPILKRYLTQLIPDPLPTQEDTAQVLLNLVSRDIKYTHHGDLEIFMRPIDVLLAGEADCSGKVILYGSLLNQVNIPFLLVYLDGHITLGVAGDFSKDNGMFFLHEGQQYTLAETTAEGFVIGLSELIEPMESWQYKFLQKPGNQTKLFDLWKSDSLEFADQVDLAGYRAPAIQ